MHDNISLTVAIIPILTQIKCMKLKIQNCYLLLNRKET